MNDTDLRLRAPRHECISAEARLLANLTHRLQVPPQEKAALYAFCDRLAAHGEQMAEEAEALRPTSERERGATVLPFRLRWSWSRSRGPDGGSAA